MRLPCLLCGLLLLVLSPAWSAAPWVSTTNYEAKRIIVVVREPHLEEARRQFIGEKTCTGVSDWTYDIYLEREDPQQPGHWVTNEQPSQTGKVKLCKGQ